MKPERWQKIDAIFDAALEREPEDRAAYLNQVCGDDEMLRAEVESLLAAAEHVGSFIETSPHPPAEEMITANQTRLTAGQHLSHYEIVSPLGAGGMGEVYLAVDNSLGRRVALKLLTESLSVDHRSHARFLREARLAATLDHPNICTIHEVGEDAGFSFIAMQYIEGKTLKEVIGNRPLGIKSVLSVSLQIADALAEAHQRGIIHRDIKPANIMITQRGQVKVLDFGLAKVVNEGIAEGVGEADNGLTRSGMIIGTPAYMSPELAKGEKIDFGTDIFSFGILLYEMMTGCVPFKGGSLPETLNAIINEPHTPARERAAEVPPELEQLIDRALAKDRAKRYQSMQEVIEALWKVAQVVGFSGSSFSEQLSHTYTTQKTAAARARRWVRVATRRKWLPATLALCLLAVVLAAFFLLPHQRSLANPKTIESIAVMPLFNVSADADIEYLTDGITEGLINDLSRLSSLKVKSRNAVFRYKGKEIDPQRAGKELDAQAVVTGQIQVRGDMLTISLEMIDTSDNHHLWGERYERKMSGIHLLQAEIARELVNKLNSKISSTEQQLVAKGYTENPDAYRLYLKGRFYFNQYTEDGDKKSIDYFEKAIEQDRNYPLAYLGLAESYLNLGLDYMPPKEAFPKARNFAARAIELDDKLAAAYAALGAINFFFDWDFKASEKQLAKALELDPASGEVYPCNLHALEVLDRPDDALAKVETAITLNPLSSIISSERGCASYYAHRYPQAIEAFQQTLKLDPEFTSAHWGLARAYGQEKKYDDSLSALKRTKELAGEWPTAIAEMGYDYAVSGKTNEAQKTLQELRRIALKGYVDPYLFALVYIGLGDRNQALTALENAYKEKSAWMPWLKVEPKFAILSEEPRFKDLIQRVGLPL